MSPLEVTALLVFWTCFGMVGYAYLTYPGVLWLLARRFGRHPDAPPPVAGALPTVSLLIAAYNEDAEIARRIDNALELDYPRDRLEIVIASDGSSDRTAEIVRSYADRGVRLLDYPERRGKATVLNSAVPELTGDFVLLSDANTQMQPEVVRCMIGWFADPRIGVVCGRLRLFGPAQGRNVDSLYWKYETFLKKCEIRLGALLGANGGLYALRRELFRPIPPDTIVDDFVIPLQAKLRTGCAIVYEPQAVAHEETPQDISAEFHRRARIGAGGFQSIVRLRGLLAPRMGWTAFTFLSHKVMRWLCPFFLIGMLLSNLCLLDQPLYGWLFLGQIAFYGGSLLVGWLPGRSRLLRPFRLTTMFTVMNVALLVGFWRWLRGGQKAAWLRTDRQPPSAAHPPSAGESEAPGENAGRS